MRALCSKGLTGVLPRRQPRPVAGFTLVELLIALILLGAVLSIAVPLMSGWLANSSLKSVARTMASDVAYLREAALSSGKTHMMSFNMNTNEYSLRWDSDGAGAYADVPNYPASRALSEFGSGVRITSVSQSPILMIANGAINPFGTVVITNDRGSTATITTLITGRSHVTYNMQ
ncbi:MAG TPA: prepilin-type N-terminal cleavage/methylation domain-containing protein [Syntrophales bacterium]|nr:prepilin-type N-terminal cleavage/methylation domain-containing protein [Syntrophales bacterium]